jgi:predicted AlkP superfamily pyrophosphatase or phosphodiesterase
MKHIRLGGSNISAFPIASRAILAGLFALPLLGTIGCSSTSLETSGETSEGKTHRGKPDSSPAVLIVSIDGLRPEFYLDPSYAAPTLRKLAAQGASAEGAIPEYPTVTYPSHTTIVSGVRSNIHGVVSNTVFTMEHGDSPRWYWETTYLKAPTLWSQALARGFKTAILSWPGTVGADATWVVPEIFPAMTPTGENKETTWELTQKHMEPAFLAELSEVIRKAPREAGQAPLQIDGFESHDRWITEASRYVMREHRPDLTLLHFINVDHAEHESGRGSKATRQAVATADTQLARLLEGVDLTRTLVILLGDHGFYDFDKLIQINSLFAREGWLKGDATQTGGVAADWKVMAHISGGAAAIYSREPGLNAQALALVKRSAGQAYTVIERAELDRLGAFPGAVCAINPKTKIAGGKPGYAMGRETQGPLITQAGAVRGNHGPLAEGPQGDRQLWTGFVAVGRGVKPGTKLGVVRLLDVAPTVARIMGLDLSHAQGKPFDL